jgi:ankyrin repeat protein
MGHKDVVEALIGRGAEVNAQKTDGCTALMLAARMGHKDIVEALLAKSAKVNAKASNGQTALFLSANILRLDEHRSPKRLKSS